LIERQLQPFGQLPDIVIRPEMHEEQPGLIVEHVIVHGGHFYPAFPQSS
jgi:hypothetical protein